MKSKILSIFASAAMLVGVVSCDNYAPNLPGGGSGKLNTASINVEVSNAENIINDSQGAKKGAQSRAAVDISNYIVTVTDAEGQPVKKWVYSEMPELPTFPAGSYTVTVTSRETPSGAEWDNPFFRGSQTFSIVADEITDVEPVKCVLSNIRVTVRFTEDLVKASAGDLRVVVRSEGSQSLAFTPAETRSGYFAAVDGLVTLSVAFTGTVSSTEEKFTKVLTEVEAGQHRIVTFGLKSNPNQPPVPSGGISTDEGINVSTDVTEEDLTVDVGYEEDTLPGNDRPGQEGDDPNGGGGDDPNPPTPPTPDAIEIIPAKGFDLEQEYDVDDFVAQGLTAAITVKVPAGIKAFNVEIDSDKLDVGELNMPNSFDLVTADEALSATLGTLGFPVGDEVKGKTELLFNITQFVGMLENFPGKSHFILTITDNNGAEKTAAFKFHKK